MHANATIVIPCYNHNTELLGALDSVYQLLPKPKEVVIVDDGSQVPVDIDVSVSDIPVRVVRQENRGLASARNVGIKEAMGDWILFLDADDTLFPAALAHLPATAKDCPIDVFASAYKLTTAQHSEDIYPQVGDPIAGLLRNNLGPIHSFCFKAAMLKQHEFNESEALRGGHEDYDLLCRLAVANAKFASLHTVLCHYQKREGSMSSHAENMRATRVKVWTRFILAVELTTSGHILAALSFIKVHYQDLMNYCREKVDAIFKLLGLKLTQNYVNYAELHFLTDGLPAERRKWLDSCAVENNSRPSGATPLLREISDWRAHSYATQIALHRFSEFTQFIQSMPSPETIYIWGNNDITSLLTRFMNAMPDVVVIDKNSRGRMNTGGTDAVSPDTLDFHENMPVFIAAHAHYNEIFETLLARGVSRKFIF